MHKRTRYLDVVHIGYKLSVILLADNSPTTSRKHCFTQCGWALTSALDCYCTSTLPAQFCRLQIKYHATRSVWLSARLRYGYLSEQAVIQSASCHSG